MVKLRRKKHAQSAHAYLLWDTAGAIAGAGIQHTATNCCPDTDHKLKDAKNQYYRIDGHFSRIIPIPKVYCKAVKKYYYSTQHCGCDGETHEHGSLNNKEKHNINATMQYY